jgi:hypothetical protein
MNKIPDDFFEERKWPFNDMEVGDIVSFDKNQSAAQLYAHVYARRSEPRKKMKTKTDKATGILYVKRIA